MSLVARGPHLAAMREKGLSLVEEGETVTVPVTASDDPAELGPQDYVIVTLKAHSVPPVVGRMQPLIGPETTIVSGVNGVPWWYFHKIGGPLEGTRLESVDPGQRAMGRVRAGPGAGVRRLPGGRGFRAGHDLAYRGQPVFAG